MNLVNGEVWELRKGNWHLTHVSKTIGIVKGVTVGTRVEVRATERAPIADKNFDDYIRETA